MLLALQHEAYTRKDWVLKCFSFFIESEDLYLQDPYPYRLLRVGGQLSFISPNPDGGFTLLPIIDAPINEALFSFKEALSLQAGDVPNLSTPVDTTYGLLFVNYSTLVYAFGSKIPYQNQEIKPTAIEALIEPLLENDTTDELPDRIYVREFLKWGESMFQLSGYSSLCVPSASPKTLTRDPRGIALRDRLLAENKDRLHDPVVVARIQKQIELLDREWVDDDGRDFYLKNKAYTDTRMKAHYLHGLEKPFTAGDRPTLIRNSLGEGWDYTNLPALVNSLREGSFNRGSETQLGGTAAKEAFRAFQNVSIAEHDCGSTLGLPFVVTDFNHSMFIGFYHLVKSIPVEITADSVKGLIGGKIYVRLPMLCKTPHTDFCEICMGKQNSLNPTGLNALGADVGSTFLQAFMKKMHVSSLTLARYRPSISIQ